jgi:hypothetical protein
MKKTRKTDRRHTPSSHAGAAPSRAAAPKVPPQTAPLKERQAAGRSLAKRTPLKEHGVWKAAVPKHDPVDLLIADSKGRTATLARAAACGERP